MSQLLLGASGKIECPRCHHIWTLPYPAVGVWCFCHQYCEAGALPKDCNVVPYTSDSGTASLYNAKASDMQNLDNPNSLNWPEGINMLNITGGTDKLHRAGYCTIHTRWTYKQPIFLEMDWEEWRQKKQEDIPVRMRETRW
jgi:hypothetical protein